MTEYSALRLVDPKDNYYVKETSMHIETSDRNGQTYMSNIYFTPPVKVTRPFKLKNGGVHIIMMSSSPGIMDGDIQDFKFDIKENSKTFITSQAYEKIFKTIKKTPKRRTKINVEKNAYFKYFPQGTIPYKNSTFDSRTHVKLEDETSKFIMVETVTPGRIAMNEKFEYKYFKLYTDVMMNDELIYVDNTLFEPEIKDMTGFGELEGFDYMTNMMLFNLSIDEKLAKEIHQKIEENGFEGGISRLYTGDHIIRMLGNGGGAKLLKMSEKIIKMIEEANDILL